MNLYQITNVYTVEEAPNVTRPAVVSNLYTHKEKMSGDNFSAIVKPLLEEHEGSLVQVVKDLVDKYGAEPVAPIHIAFSGGTVSPSELEERTGRNI